MLLRGAQAAESWRGRLWAKDEEGMGGRGWGWGWEKNLGMVDRDGHRDGGWGLGWGWEKDLVDRDGHRDGDGMALELRMWLQKSLSEPSSQHLCCDLCSG